MELQGEYKGWKITHDGGDYNATKGEATIKRIGDLDKLKRQIDRMERHAMKKFERIPALMRRGMSEGTITSIASIDESYSGLKNRVSVWFSFKKPDQYNAKREKTDIENLIKDTPGNRERGQEIKRLLGLTVALDKELEGFTVEELLPEGAQ